MEYIRKIEARQGVFGPPAISEFHEWGARKRPTARRGLRADRQQREIGGDAILRDIHLHLAGVRSELWVD
jgi:hypothetical protein